MIPTKKDPHQDREERAIDALIAGMLRPSSRDEALQSCDIAPFDGPQETGLSAAAEAALAKLGSNPAALIFRGREAPSEEQGVAAEALAGAFCGMYRKNATGENAPEDEAELERKRQEAIKKLGNKDGRNHGPKDGQPD